MQRRKQRMGKVKPKKMRQGMPRQALDKHVETLEALRKPRFRMVGIGSPMPSFKFPKDVVFFGQSVVLGSAFRTNTGLSGNSIQGAAAPYGIAFAFSIGDIPDAASLGAAFDQFLLYRVVVRIKFRIPSTSTYSQLFVVNDVDNAAIPSSLANVESYQNCQVLRGSMVGANVGDSLVCDIATTIAIPSVTGNMAIPATWQDVATATNNHFGIKAWYETTSTADAQWNVDAMYYYGFRNTQ